jgi:hypothetical protein
MARARELARKLHGRLGTTMSGVCFWGLGRPWLPAGLSIY